MRAIRHLLTKPSTDWRPAFASLVAGGAALLIGNTVESVVVSALHAHPAELGWISDLVLSGGLAVVSYLWLHLRAVERRLTDMERARIALDTQLRLAAEIQSKLLPPVPARTNGFRWAARLVPAWTIGGDFYDFAQHDDGSVLVVVADVSGKGVPAALVHASLHAMFHEAVRYTAEPSEIATRLDRALYADGGGTPYSTAFIGRFEPSPARLTYVNAGHPEAILRAGSAERTLVSTAPPLGMLPHVGFPAVRLELESAEIGIIVTDGVTEALEGTPLTLAALLRRSEVLLGGPEAICERIIDAAGRAPGPLGVAEWHDDRTVLVFQVE